MHIEGQNFPKLHLKWLTLSAVIIALTTQGCASQPSSESDALQADKLAPAKSANAEVPAATNSENVEASPQHILDQYALDRLKQMSGNLASAKAFTYHSSNTLELEAITGQFLTFFGDAEVALQRPNKLRVNVSGDVPNLQLYFDGSNVSVYDPQKNVHAIAGPLQTVDQLVAFVKAKAEYMKFPSADFVQSDPYALMTENLSDAIVVGPTLVNGIPCEHFAYIVPGVNWEIWIETGKHPLPRRLAMTYTNVENFPRYLVEYSNWNMKPKLSPDKFKFNIPANSIQIEFAHRDQPLLK